MKQTQQRGVAQQAAATTQKQAIVKQKEEIKKVIENRGAIVTSNIPEYLRQEGPVLGIESWRPSDIKIARFQLAQDQTRAAKKQNKDFYIDGLEPGMFFNSMTHEVYGSEVFFIPILKTLPKRVRMPEEFTGSGGPLCRSENGKVGEGDPGGLCRKCKYSLWVDGRPPLCSEMITYHMFPLPERDHVPTPEEWCVWGARKSAITAAQLLGRLYAMRGPVDLFKCVFKMSSFWDTKQTQPCWVPKVDNALWATEEQYAIARAFYPQVRNLELSGQVHVDEIVDDEDAIEVSPEVSTDETDRPPF